MKILNKKNTNIIQDTHLSFNLKKKNRHTCCSSYIVCRVGKVQHMRVSLGCGGPVTFSAAAAAVSLIILMRPRLKRNDALLRCDAPRLCRRQSYEYIKC